MSHLSEALTKYYARDGKKILFSNGFSLNGLAMAMWEGLDFQQVDASVLSRVLKGERLFTAQQLEIFCSILHVSAKEKAYLFACLEQDRTTKLNLYVGTTHINPLLVQETIVQLTKGAFTMFYEGDYEALSERYELISQLANAYKLSNRDTKLIDEAVGLNIYLKGRTIANGELPSRVIEKVYPVFCQLIGMSQRTGSRLLYGYAYVLLSTTYYLAGGYSDASKKHKFYSTSVKLAKEAIKNLPIDDHESLFALRSMAASSSYTHDEETIAYVLRTAREIIPKQPEANYINTLHLSMTLSKSLAAAKASNPFAVQEFATQYFHRDLANTGVYEVSGIKEEVDTLLLLNTGDSMYITGKLREGLKLAERYKLRRQEKYFTKLLDTV